MVYLNQGAMHHDIDADPALYVMVEDSRDYRIFGHGSNAGTAIGWRWRGQLGNLDDFEGDYLEIGFEFLERVWLGDDEWAVARKIATLLTLFKDPADLPLREEA